MWLNNSKLKWELKDSDMNRSVVLSRTGLNLISENIGSIFGNLVDFSDSVSGLYVYPFPLVKDMRNVLTILETPKGTITGGVCKATYTPPNYTYFHMGQHLVERYFNNFADFKGYTHIKIYLPMMGEVEVDVNECMGKYLQFRLIVDFTTGMGLYVIGVSETPIYPIDEKFSNSKNDESIRVISTFECRIGQEVPWGTTNAGDLKRNIILGTLKVGTAIATKGMSLTVPERTVTNTTRQSTNLASPDHTQFRTSSTKTTTVSVSSKTPEKAKFASETFNNSIDIINTTAPSGHTDRVNNGYLNAYLSGRIHITYYRPNFVPENIEYSSLFGYPVGDVRKLSNVGGYTQISEIHIEGEGFEAITQNESVMLSNLLQEGVIFPVIASPTIVIKNDYLEITYGESGGTFTIYANGEPIRTTTSTRIYLRNMLETGTYSIYVTYTDSNGEMSGNSNSVFYDLTRTYFILDSYSPSFTEIYEFTEGMTWREWVSSRFNTNPYIYVNQFNELVYNIPQYGEKKIYTDNTYFYPVDVDSEIIANNEYEVYPTY